MIDILTPPDLSSLDLILSPLTGQSSFVLLQAAVQPEQDKQCVRLHFESSRAGGCFSMHLKGSWDDARIAQFHEWKKAQGIHPDTELIAQEIATNLLKLFGGMIPPAITCAPPRGKTPPAQPHAAHELARAVALKLGIETRDMIGRVGTDEQKYRSRHDNLRDKTVFQCLDSDENRLILVVDDVTTTGTTLVRVRQALTGKPTLLLAYVVWH